MRNLRGTCAGLELYVDQIETIGRCKDFHAHVMNEESAVGRLFINGASCRLAFPADSHLLLLMPSPEPENPVLQSVKNKLAHSLLTKATRKRKSKSAALLCHR